METIRFAGSEDVAGISRIMAEAWDALEHKEWYITDTDDFIRDIIENKKGYGLVCEIDGQIGGFMIVMHPDEDDDKYTRYVAGADSTNTAHLETSAVALARRGRGIERKLAVYAGELEKERGTKYLLCTVHPDNLASFKSLQRAGLEPVMTSETIYSHGKYLRTLMCRRLQ